MNTTLINQLLFSAFMVILALGSTQAETKELSPPSDEMLLHLKEQSKALPIVVKDGLLLTNVEIDKSQKKVIRTYNFAFLDFARASDGTKRRITSQIHGELFQQCQDHKEIIFNDNYSFHYRFIDGAQSLVILNVIDADRCQQFAELRLG